MKKRVAWVTIFCCFWLSGIVVGPVEAQEGQGDGLSDFTSRIAEVFGTPIKRGCRSREERVREQRDIQSCVPGDT